MSVHPIIDAYIVGEDLTAQEDNLMSKYYPDWNCYRKPTNYTGIKGTIVCLVIFKDRVEFGSSNDWYADRFKREFEKLGLEYEFEYAKLTIQHQVFMRPHFKVYIGRPDLIVDFCKNFEQMIKDIELRRFHE